MELPYTLAGAGISLIVLAIVFAPIERALPARDQKFMRREWLIDLWFFLGQYLLWGGLVVSALDFTSSYFHDHLSHDWAALMSTQPWSLQAFEALLLSDLAIYWFHRLQHRVPWLWHFHAVHHTAEHLDWLAAHREHPLDGLATQLVINIPIFLLGFPTNTIALVVAFRGLWAIFIHANVRVSIGPLRYVIGSPELHHWHHAKEGGECNFANLSPLMDLLFGTYRCPPCEPAAFGIQEPFPRGYIAQLCYPFKKLASSKASTPQKARL